MSSLIVWDMPRRVYLNLSWFDGAVFRLLFPTFDACCFIAAAPIFCFHTATAPFFSLLHTAFFTVVAPTTRLFFCIETAVFFSAYRSRLDDYGRWASRDSIPPPQPYRLRAANVDEWGGEITRSRTNFP